MTNKSASSPYVTSAMSVLYTLAVLTATVGTSDQAIVSCSATTCSACVGDTSCGWFSCQGAIASCAAKVSSPNCDKVPCTRPPSPPSPPSPPPPTFLMGCNNLPQSKMAFCNASLPRKDRVEDLIQRLTIAERLAMLRAANPAVPRLGKVYIYVSAI